MQIVDLHKHCVRKQKKLKVGYIFLAFWEELLEVNFKPKLSWEQSFI